MERLLKKFRENDLPMQIGCQIVPEINEWPRNQGQINKNGQDALPNILLFFPGKDTISIKVTPEIEFLRHLRKREIDIIGEVGITIMIKNHKDIGMAYIWKSKVPTEKLQAELSPYNG